MKVQVVTNATGGASQFRLFVGEGLAPPELVLVIMRISDRSVTDIRR